MNIQDLVDEFEAIYDESMWADVTATIFTDTNLSLKFAVTKEGLRREMELHCSEVAAYRISDHYLEWLYLEGNSPEIMAYTGKATTYVMWGDDVDWPTLLGRITQEFGYVPNLLKHEYVRETVKRADYRLPILVPDALEARFHELIGGLDVSAYVHQRREEAEGLQTLRFGNDSYVIAKSFALVESAT